MDLCHTLHLLRVSVVKTMGAAMRTGCIATHQSLNAKQYQMKLGFRPVPRQTIPTLITKLVSVVPAFVHPRSMDRIVYHRLVVAVVLREHSELTVPTVVKSAVPEHLRPLLVWWVDALDALPVNMAQQRVKPLKRRVKIAVLEKPRICLAQPVNRLAKIV